MKNEVKEITEAEYKEFFEWLLEKEVKLEKELDLTLAHDYNEPYIYFTSEIEKFFETTPMKRIGKISQLGTSIINNDNTYHTRLEHCKGAYKNALDFWSIKYKEDENFKKKDQNEKLMILADIMEMARHDDCHPMLSHGLEGLLCNGEIDHDDIGNKILLESKEYKEALNNIKNGLYEIMCNNITNRTSAFSLLEESSLDFDRLDYIVRDLLYLGLPQVRPIMDNIIAKGKLRTIEINGKKEEVPVFDYESIEDIEYFIMVRKDCYMNEYSSPNRNIMDKAVKQFCMQMLDDKSEYGMFIKEAVSNYTKSTLDEIDIEKYLKTNDIRFYSDVIEIAEKHPNEKIRQLARFCLPSLNGLIQMTIELLDTKNNKEYTENDMQFIEKIKELKSNKSELGKDLRKSNFKSDMYKMVEDGEKVNQVQKEIEEVLGKQQFKDDDGIFIWDRYVKVYNKEEPIYIEKDGEVTTFDKVTNLNLENIRVRGICVISSIMELKGYTKEQIDEVCGILEKYQYIDTEPKLTTTNRMSKFKVGQEPYIIGIEER